MLPSHSYGVIDRFAPAPAETAIARLRTFFMVAGIYVVPVVLLRSGLIPYSWRFPTLMVAAIAAAALAASRRYSAIRLGLGRPKFLSVLAWSVIPSVLLFAGIFRADLQHRFQLTPSLPFYLFFVVLSAPAQEFLYRSFLFAELATAGVPRFGIVVISAALYSFMHTIARDRTTTILTFVVGLIWALIFLRTKNFYIVALSHAGLGAAAITLGVI